MRRSIRLQNGIFHLKFALSSLLLLFLLLLFSSSSLWVFTGEETREFQGRESYYVAKRYGRRPHTHTKLDSGYRVHFLIYTLCSLHPLPLTMKKEIHICPLVVLILMI